LHEDVGWVLCHKVANVENTDKERIFLAFEMGFLDKTVGGGLGDSLSILLASAKQRTNMILPTCQQTGFR
jgi:hypothetical protein